MSYDNAKACAVVETTDVSPNLIDVDHQNPREIQNIYDSNSKQPKLPIVDVPSTFLDTDGKCFIYLFWISYQLEKQYEFSGPKTC